MFWHLYRQDKDDTTQNEADNHEIYIIKDVIEIFAVKIMADLVTRYIT